MKQFLLIALCFSFISTAQAQTLESNDWSISIGGSEFATARFQNGGLSLSADGSPFEAFSTYTNTVNTFSITDLPDSDGGCNDAVGFYTYSITGDILDFTLVSDACQERLEVIAGGVWQAVTGATSTEEFESESTFNIYPNPVVDALVIEVDEAELGAAYSVLSIDGRVISTGVINNSITRMDLSGLPTGLYLVQYGEQANTQPFVKQ